MSDPAFETQTVEDRLRKYCGGVGLEAASVITALRAEVESLKDPGVVHVNMLRGGIAKPSIAQIVHIYGEDAIRGALTQTKDTTNARV